jgi:hypothetical protein
MKKKTVNSLKINLNIKKWKQNGNNNINKESLMIFY